MEPTKRRSFVQRILCVFGGAMGASLIQPQATTSLGESSAETVIDTPAQAGSVRYYLRARHQHKAAQHGAHVVCRGELLEKPDGDAIGEFYSNCFCAESAVGTTNPFASSNVELHTVRLKDGTLFGMGANQPKAAREKVHAILGGTGRFAGARGTYTIADSGAPNALAQLTITTIS